MAGIACTQSRAMDADACLLLNDQALGRKAPADFPIDSSVLPALRSRVKLAVRLDNILRTGTKQRAEAKWKAQAAKDLDVDASDDDNAIVRHEISGRSRGREDPKVAVLQQVTVAWGQAQPVSTCTQNQLEARIICSMTHPATVKADFLAKHQLMTP